MLVAGPNPTNVQFKVAYQNRLKKEWGELKKKNPALHSMIEHLAGFSGIALGQPLVVTEIWRSEQEQKKMYGPNTKKKSPHQHWCAVDLRCIDIATEKRQYLEHALRRYDQWNRFSHMPSASRTVWIHAVAGGAIHFHIQYWGYNYALPSRFELLERDVSKMA